MAGAIEGGGETRGGKQQSKRGTWRGERKRKKLEGEEVEEGGYEGRKHQRRRWRRMVEGREGEERAQADSGEDEQEKRSDAMRREAQLPLP